MIQPNKKTVPSHPQVILFLMEHTKKICSKEGVCCSFPVKACALCLTGKHSYFMMCQFRMNLYNMNRTKTCNFGGK